MCLYCGGLLGYTGFRRSSNWSDLIFLWDSQEQLHCKKSLLNRDQKDGTKWELSLASISGIQGNGCCPRVAPIVGALSSDW